MLLRRNGPPFLYHHTDLNVSSASLGKESGEMGVIISEKTPARCRAYLSVYLEQTVPKPLAGADGMCAAAFSIGLSSQHLHSHLRT